MADVFLAALDRPKQGGGVGLFDNNHTEPITSPRSLAAIRCEGYQPHQLLPLPPMEDASPTFRRKRQTAWEEERAKRVRSCQERYAALQSEAEKQKKKKTRDAAGGGPSALASREQQQKARAAQMKASATRTLEKMVADELRLKSDRDEAGASVGKKTAAVLSRREARQKLLHDQTDQVAARNAARQAAAEAAQRQLDDAWEQKRRAGHAAAAAAERRLAAARDQATAGRQQVADRRRGQIEHTREKRRAELKTRVLQLLDKRTAAEGTLGSRLDERNRKIREKSEDVALRTMMIADRVDRARVIEEVKRETIAKKIGEKDQRVARLAQIRGKVQEDQQKVEEEMRRKREALAQWRTAAQVTGDYTLPGWYTEPTQHSVPLVTSASLIKPVDKKHYSPWIWNDDH